MRSRAVSVAVANIDLLERSQASASDAFGDVVPVMIPMLTYKALSDAAARKRQTVAEVIAHALTIALEDDHA